MGLMDIRRRILADAPQLATATGAVASFQTDMAVPLKSCQFAIEPVQSGTGDPSPSNVRPIAGFSSAKIVRVGKNVFDTSRTLGELVPTTGTPVNRQFDTSKFYKGVNQTNYYYPSIVTNVSLANGILSFETTSVAYGVGFPLKLKGGSKFKLSYTGTNLDTTRFSFYDRNGAYLSNAAMSSEGGNSIPDNADITIIVFFANATNTTATVSNIQLEVGDDATAYSPYTGNQIAVTFPAQGKNLFGGEMGVRWDMPLKTGEKYTLSATCTGTGYGVFRTYKEGGVFVQSFILLSGTGDRWLSAMTMSADADYIIISRSADTLTMTDIMLESGENDSPSYEPYTNTVYGGTVDVVTGVLRVTWVKRSCADFSAIDPPNQSYNPPWNHRWSLQNWITGGTWERDFTGNKIMCDSLSADTGCDAVGEFQSGSGYNNIYVYDDTISTVDEFKQKYADVYFAYPVKSQFFKTYQLTPQQITALKGQNNVWCDTGNTTVQYWKH